MKYTSKNPKYKPGQVFIHKSSPDYVVKLVEKGQYGRWICEIISGSVPKHSGVKAWYTETTRYVQYSTCAFTNCFIQSEMGQILYMGEERGTKV